MSRQTSIYNQLDEYVNDIFFNYQEDLGIKSGDIFLTDAFTLDELLQDVSKLIDHILDYQQNGIE